MKKSDGIILKLNDFLSNRSTIRKKGFPQLVYLKRAHYIRCHVREFAGHFCDTLPQILFDDIHVRRDVGLFACAFRLTIAKVVIAGYA